ncbi:hypothetical protein EPA93_33440 [Ktedonosporobacter rubrisoli]|uniref:Uncharacterized protein n=1 Tax=Ktedonosporobacter rubrisoli TaxID=2509675 RepID=A0A4P6JZQ9_KTERU|nr:hypothetical protein [Ktedonosporobacter rubrisoli]QBD80616.1 hypothetical protein EPA93_33440 [Ktedonosporobacter rubrisoli]
MQQTMKQLAHPKRLEMLFHGVKTVRLIGALLRDRRVHIMRKTLFLGSVAALLLVLFFPDLFSEAILSTVLPLVGTILGVPLDAGLDWIAFALLVSNMLRFFPAERVAEHYTSIF